MLSKLLENIVYTLLKLYGIYINPNITPPNGKITTLGEIKTNKEYQGH